jgi:hypothetical protein
MRARWLWIGPVALVAFTFFIFVGGEIVRLLWNWLLPPLFGWRSISFWQALALLALCRILFGRFGFRPGHGSRMRRRMVGRWARMTREERQRFRQRMRERWGFAPPAGGEPAGGGPAQTI